MKRLVSNRNNVREKKKENHELISSKASNRANKHLMQCEYLIKTTGGITVTSS